MLPDSWRNCCTPLINAYCLFLCLLPFFYLFSYSGFPYLFFTDTPHCATSIVELILHHQFYITLWKEVAMWNMTKCILYGWFICTAWCFIYIGILNRTIYYQNLCQFYYLTDFVLVSCQFIDGYFFLMPNFGHKNN